MNPKQADNIHPSISLKRLFGHTAVYTVGMVAQKVIGFLMIPVYTRYLLPADYGVLELLTTTFEIVGIFAGMGVTVAMTRHYYQYDKDKDRKAVVSTALIISLVVYPLTIGILYLLSGKISRLIFGTDIYRLHLNLMIFSFLGSTLLEIPLAYLRVRERSVRFVLLGLARLLIALSLNIYFVCILKLAVIGVLYSGIITGGLLSAYLVFSTIKDTGLNFSRHKAKEMMRYGVPIAFSFLGSFVLTFSDRYFLRVYSSLAEVGVYSLAYRFAGVIPFLVVTPFMQMWGVKRFEIANLPDAHDMFRKLFNYYAFVLITVGLILSIFIKPVVHLVATPSYYAAHHIVPMLILSYLIYGFLNMINIGILVSRKTIYMSFAYLISSLVCLGSNFMLIPRWGAAGAAWATVISYLVLFMFSYRFSQSLYKLNYDWYPIGKLIFAAIILYFVGYRYDPSDTYLSIMLRLFLLGCYLAYAFLGGYFTRDEKRTIIGMIANPLAGSGQLFGNPSVKK